MEAARLRAVKGMPHIGLLSPCRWGCGPAPMEAADAASLSRGMPHMGLLSPCWGDSAPTPPGVTAQPGKLSAGGGGARTGGGESEVMPTLPLDGCCCGVLEGSLAAAAIGPQTSAHSSNGRCGGGVDVSRLRLAAALLVAASQFGPQTSAHSENGRCGGGVDVSRLRLAAALLVAAL